MFTIALLTAIACLAVFWLRMRFTARQKPTVDAAALEAQLDQMIASFDLNDRALASENRKFRRQVRQYTKQRTQTPVGAKNISPDQQIASQSVKQLPLRSPQKPRSSVSLHPTNHKPLTTSHQFSPSASPREPLPPPLKRNLWPAAILSFCKKAALTTLRFPFQVAVKSFFNLFARKIPPAPPPEPLMQSRSA